MKSEKVIRTLSKFQKNGDTLLDEFELEGIKLKELQDLFQQPSENPMYDCYPVSQTQASYLQKYADEKIDIVSYDYFLECHTFE